MSRVMKLVCIWCLALVLPLQGLAAGCLLDCARSHMPATGTMTAAAESEAQAHPCHAGTAQLETAADGIDEGSTPDAGHRCSACAACGAAPALPAAGPVLGEPDAVRERGTLAVTPLARVAATGPERPPRATA